MDINPNGFQNFIYSVKSLDGFPSIMLYILIFFALVGGSVLTAITFAILMDKYSWKKQILLLFGLRIFQFGTGISIIIYFIGFFFRSYPIEMGVGWEIFTIFLAVLMSTLVAFVGLLAIFLIIYYTIWQPILIVYKFIKKK